MSGTPWSAIRSTGPDELLPGIHRFRLDPAAGSVQTFARPPSASRFPLSFEFEGTSFSFQALLPPDLQGFLGKRFGMKTRGIRVKPQISQITQIEEGLGHLFFGFIWDRNSHRTVVKESSEFQIRSLCRKEIAPTQKKRGRMSQSTSTSLAQTRNPFLNL